MTYGNGDELDKLERALEAAGMAWWWMELPSGVVFFSENKTKMLGRDKKDFFHYTAFTKLVHPDDYEPMMAAMMAHLEGKSPLYETTYRIKMKNGLYKAFYDKGKIVGKNGNDVLMAGIVFDVDGINVDLIQRAQQ